MSRSSMMRDAGLFILAILIGLAIFYFYVIPNFLPNSAFPLYFHFGSFTIAGHLFFDILACLVGYLYYSKLQKKNDFLSADQRFFVLMGGAAGALIGSRLLGALEDPQMFLHPPTLLYYYESSTIVGAILGAVIGIEITKWFMKIKKSTGDLITLPLIVAMAVGRMGCLVSGVADHTVGNPSNLPWAFAQGDGIPRQPTSLYEILFLLVLFFVLRAMQKNNMFPEGMLFRMFIILYLTFRFLIEFIKPGDPLLLGLTGIQIASLIGALYYIIRMKIDHYRDKRYNIITA